DLLSRSPSNFRGDFGTGGRQTLSRSFWNHRAVLRSYPLRFGDLIMPKEYAFPPKFKVIVNHLKAVRTLDEYVNGAVLKKDMQDLFNHVMRELTNKVLRPAGWSDMHCDK